MYSESDIISVYNFLKDTPEGPLRKRLVAGEFSDGHFRWLMKVVRSVPQPDFVEAFNSESMPKVRMTPSEHPLREKMWPMCKGKFLSLGLLATAKAA